MRNIILATLFLLVPVTLQAAEPLKVTYGLYASGFNVVEIDGTYTLNKDKYELSMDLKTAGLLGTLASWSGVMKTNGLYKDDLAMPIEHSFASTWREDTQTRTLSFGDDGNLRSHTKEEKGRIEDKMPSKDVYEGGAVDTLTALLRAMEQQSCAGTYDVVDGKRRFDMKFTSKGNVEIKKSRYTIFDGMAEKCEIEIISTAGKWRDKKRGWMSIQDQAKNNGHLPTLWFGKLRDDFPPVPVRFLIKTDYGTMVMHVQNVN